MALPKLIPVREAAQMLGISTQRVYQLIDTEQLQNATPYVIGKGKSVRRSRGVRVLLHEVQQRKTQMEATR